MSGSQRLALIAAAAALLIGGFFVARGGSSDTASTAPGTSAPTAASPEPATGTAPAATSTSTASTPTTAAPATPVIVVTGGKPEGGVKKLDFSKGDQIAFTVRSDVADEIHVHGYDVKKDVKAGGTVTFAFKADIEGIFEVELEGAAVQIASLKVTP